MAVRGRAEDDVPDESPERRVPESRLAWFVEALRAELARAGVSDDEPAPGDHEVPREPARWRSAIRAWGWRAADQ